MKTNRKNTGLHDRKAILSTLWIFVVLNYLYCDVISLMDADVLNEFLTGNAGGMQITQGFLFGAGILMEISISMVLLARVLNYRPNRWANIIAGTITTSVQLLTLFVNTPTMYYAFFSVIEIAATAFIVWYAWTWRQPEASVEAEIAPITGKTAMTVGEN